MLPVTSKLFSVLLLVLNTPEAFCDGLHYFESYQSELVFDDDCRYDPKENEFYVCTENELVSNTLEIILDYWVPDTRSQRDDPKTKAAKTLNCINTFVTHKVSRGLNLLVLQ